MLKRNLCAWESNREIRDRKKTLGFVQKNMNRTLGKRERRNKSNFVYSRVRIKGSTSTCTCADKIDKLMGGEEDQSVKLLKIHLQLMTLTYLRYNWRTGIFSYHAI